MRRLSKNQCRLDLRRLVLLACAVMMVFAVLPAAAYADQERETVRVGYYENEVFQEGAEDGAVKTGYAYEYYQKLSEYTGWRYTYVYGGFNELYQMLLDGEIDLLAGLAWREEREALIGYPDAVMGNESYYLVKHDEDDVITAEPASLNGSRIGVLDSAMVDVLNRYLDDHGVAATVVAYPDYTKLFDAFDSHAVDILAAESDGAHGRDHAEVISVFGASDYYLCVNKSRPDLLAELNAAQAMLAVSEPSYLTTLRSRYYSVSVTARAFSQAEREWLDGHASLHVGYFDNYLPFSDTDEQGNVNGAVKDIVSAILDAVGRPDIAVTYSGYKSYDDMIAAINAGEVDAVFPVGGGLFYSEENGIYQSNTVSAAPAELVYRGEFSEETTGHFAINENNRMQYYFVRTNYPDAEITFCQSIDECLSAVLAGKAGCATMNGLRANDILRNRKYNALSHRQTSYMDSRCFGVEIGNEGLLRLLNRGISILGVEYTQNLLHRYNDGLFSYGFADVLRDHMALFGSIVLAIAAIIIFLLVRDSRRSKQEVREKEASRLELEEKNRELAESEKALSDALITAEHANNAKTAFLNSMSHDIRTPMNAIIGLTTIAEKNAGDVESTRESLRKIGLASNHLLTLINDILDISKVESGKLKLSPLTFSIVETVENLVNLSQPMVKEKNIEFFFHINRMEKEYLYADQLRLNQIYINILSNAIKYTQPGGRVSVEMREEVSTQPGCIRLTYVVADTGMGMSPEFMKTMYQPFSRQTDSRVNSIQGTGLGLAITKQMVELMGGTIDCQSEQGKGTTFTVVLDIPVAEKQRDDMHLDSIDALIVDDDEILLSTASDILGSLGAKVDQAHSGAEALSMIAGRHESGRDYSIVIIDWRMPDTDGVETIRRIRAEIDENIPILLVSSYDWSDIEDLAKEAGANGFVSKPLFRSTLYDKINALIGTEPKSVEPEDDYSDLAGLHILVAEDNDVNWEIISAMLGMFGITCDRAENGRICVDTMREAEKGRYELIFMDVQMPEMNGLDATRAIRKLEDPWASSIPIIAMTADAFSENVTECLNAGMNGHIAKPIDIKLVIKEIRRIKEGREQA